MADATVAYALAQGLLDAGLRRIYGLPGEDHLRLLDAFEAVGLQYVAARDEGSAAIMAATDAQASGLPGVVVVTIGPGLTNALNGLAYAFLDHIPLLMITGQHTADRAPLIVRQLMDNHRLVDGLTKWTTTASTRIHQILARALDTALAPPRGPVLLELRDDVASRPASDSAADWPLLQSGARTVTLTGGPDDRTRACLEDIRLQLATAEHPAMLVGGCPTDPRVSRALARAAAAWRAPVFVSPTALGTLTTDDPWFAGTFMNGNFERSVLDRADVLIAVDLDARDFFNAAWRYRAPVVAINTSPDAQRYAPTQHQVVGDTATILDALAPDSGPGGSASAWAAADVAAYRAAVEQPFHLRDEAAFTIPSALRRARQRLPADTLVAVDAGFGKPITSYLWTAPRPNHYFTAHGLSTMGYALPAANALQMTYPDRPVIAFMGDGSLLMRAAEIGVAVEHACAPIYVAWMDGALAQIEVKQLRQGLRPVGARLPLMSCAKLAEAFGGRGVDVDTLDDFDAALQAACRERRLPTLIGARVDQTCRAEWYELIRG